MKKTRILASLVAVMMVVSMLPMMASAAASDTLIEAIADVLGNETAVVATSSTWGVVDLDFTADGVASTEGLTVVGEVAFDAENGAVFPAETAPVVEDAGDGEGEGEEETVTIPTVKYTGIAGNTSSILNQGWGAIVASGNVAFGFKLNETGNLTIETEDLYRDGKVQIEVSPSGVVVYGSDLDFLAGVEGEENNANRQEVIAENLVDYQPGTEWNDVLVTKTQATAGGGYRVYMKKASDTAFTLVAEATYFAGGGDWTNGSLRFMGYDAAVNYATSYVGTLKPIETIAQIMGSDSASNWLYSEKYTTGDTPAGVTASGVTNTSEGVVFTAATSGSWKLTTAADYWKGVNTTVIKGKFSNSASSEKVFITANTPNGSGRHYLTLFPNGLTTTNSAGRADFDFGTDWFELAIYSYEGSHDIYVKNAATDNKWKFLITNTNRDGSATFFTMNSYATNAGTFTMQSMDIYTASETYNTVEEILGGNLVSTYSFDFDSKFDTSIMDKSSAAMTTGLDCTDENGIDLNDGVWNFNAYITKNWSPLNGNLPGETYIPQALYFKLKLNSAASEITVTAGTPNVYGRLYRSLKVGSAMTLGGSEGKILVNLAPDTNWMEHLIVPAATEAGGYSHYVKSETLTKGVWVKIIEATNYRESSSQKTRIGVNFSTGDVCLKSLKTYQVGLADEAAKPANATLLYHEDNMDKEGAYPNLSIQSGNYETEGVVSFPAVDSATYGKYTLNYAGIPVGGYAEFKTSSNGAIIMSFSDGEKYVTFNAFKPYSGVVGQEKTLLVGEGNNDSRIWRVVRTEDGYTFYSKKDGDNGWVKLTENVGSDVSTEDSPKITMTFRNHADGTSVGTGALDYMKIYGPSRDDLLIVTDGNGTKELKDGDIIGYGNGLRPIVNAETGKVLVVNYQRNLVTKFTVLDVSELSVDKMVSVVKGGTDTVKVFLWNDVDGKMANLTEALTLKFPSGN